MRSHTITVLGLVLLGSAGAWSADSFYLNLLRSGETSLVAGRLQEAEGTLRIACFGLLDDPPVLAKCLATLAVAQDRMGDGPGFSSTLARLVEVEERFDGLSGAEIDDDVAAALGDALRRRVSSSVLATSPALSELVPGEVDQLRELPPGDRRRELERLAAAEPGNPTWKVMLGDLELATGRDKRARRAYEEALRIDAGCSAAHLGLARIARSDRDWGIVARHLSESGAASSDVGIAAQMLTALIEDGRPQTALEAAEGLPPDIVAADEVVAVLERATELVTPPAAAPEAPDLDAADPASATNESGSAQDVPYAGEEAALPEPGGDGPTIAAASGTPTTVATPEGGAPDLAPTEPGQTSADPGADEALAGLTESDPSTAVEPVVPDDVPEPNESPTDFVGATAPDSSGSSLPAGPRSETSGGAGESGGIAAGDGVREPTAAGLVSAPAATAFRFVDLKVQSTGTRTVVTVTADAPIPVNSVRHSRMQDPPRHLVRIAGIARIDWSYLVNVGDGRVRSVRTAVHDELNPPEVHLVIDRGDDAVAVTSVRVAGRVLLIEVE